MIRKLLIVISLASYIGMIGCVSDQNIPASDEDDVAMSDSSAVSDDAGLESSDEDLSSELDSLDESATAEGASEQGLESELDAVDDELGTDVAQQPEPVTPEPEPAIEAENLEAIEEPAPAPAPERARITNIRYLANQAGGTIVVEATGPLTYQARNEGSQFVVEIENADLPAKLKHAFPVKDATSAFKTLSANQDAGPTRIVVQMKDGANGQPIVQNEGNSLLVIPASSPLIAETTPLSKESPPQPTQPLGAQSLDEFLTGNQKFFGKPISLQTKDADVRDVVNFIAEESGANIIMSDEVKGKISVKIRRIPWDQALVTVMRAKKLGYSRQGNVIRISSMQELQEETDAAAKIIETQKNIAPVRVKVIPVNYANVEELAKQVPAFLSKDGKVVVDQRSNTILVTDRDNVLEKVERIIKALDLQPNQVLIEGKIVEAQEQFSSFVGVNWGLSGSPVTLSQNAGLNGTPLLLAPSFGVSTFDSVANNPLRTGFRIGTLDFIGNLTATLQLAEKDSIAKVISSPRISTLNREKASISQSGEQITVSTTINNVSNEKTFQEKRTPITLDLTVTPQITADNSVIMDMEVKRQFAGAVEDQDTKARAINTRTAKTKVLVRNGQTAVIGGIYQSDEQTTENGVPVLKDIPIFGWLFKSKSKERTKNELLIFLTPRIMATSQASALE